MKNLAEDIKVAPGEGFRGFGNLGLEGSRALDAPNIFTNFISSMIGVLTVIAIIWFVFIFIAGAISYMSAGGDKAAVESARKKIVNGLIGLVMVVIAIFIVKLIGYLIGIPEPGRCTISFRDHARSGACPGVRRTHGG
jgi:hypothetical protein